MHPPSEEGNIGTVSEKLAVGNQPSAPTASRGRLRLQPKQGQNQGENGLRPIGHRPVEWHFDVCFQQSGQRGGGVGNRRDRPTSPGSEKRNPTPISAQPCQDRAWPGPGWGYRLRNPKPIWDDWDLMGSMGRGIGDAPQESQNGLSDDLRNPKTVANSRVLRLQYPRSHLIR